MEDDGNINAGSGQFWPGALLQGINRTTSSVVQNNSISLDNSSLSDLF